MALRGNLKDFSLPDVFQLVQLSGKTGVLRIVRPDAEGSIWFRDGEVFFAQSNWRHELLGDRLVSAQRITPAALERALEMHKAEGGERRLGEILVSEGYITQHVLETFVQEQIQDTIFDIMRWDEGDFDFEVLPEVLHEDIGLSVSVENIVMEGSRRLEEWNRIKKKVPSADMVFKMATAPGEGTFEISLKPVEWNLLLLIDGTRSVRELAEEVRSTDFEVARVIYGLFSAGLLEVPSDEEVERLRAERAAREEKRARAAAARAEREASGPSASEPEADASAVVEPEPEAHVPKDAAVEKQPEEASAGEDVRAAPEMPEFLSVGAEPPSDDDMAVFTEMMEAVLSPHDAAAAETLEEEPPATPEEPLDEVPQPGYEPETADETPVVPYAPTVEDAWDESALLAEMGLVQPPAPADEVQYQEPPAEAGQHAEPAAESGDVGFGAIPESEITEIPAPPVAEMESVQFTRTGDFETDLRTLGLGEYPPELLEPESVQSISEEPAPVHEGVAETATPGGEFDQDLDSLLESLGASADEGSGVIASETDFGAEQSAGEYISTDSFLAEFDTGGGLSGGLGDELTALTGGGTGRARPVTTVNAIPEPGEGGRLHIDQAVDKELLEKIIQGIEDL
ncbi:MAG TPA: hypothetical protein DCP20_04095 [Coriobacteriia bacterium]|nr:hypothetical protein [Coriobacteriia bacterium]